MLKKRADKQAATLETARSITRAFWAGNGSIESLAEARLQLKRLKLTPDQLHDLRDGLPLGGAGTTTSKAVRMDRTLKRLEKEPA